MEEPGSLGIYIHIPFCRTKCPYCDFVSQPIAGSIPTEFIEALCREIIAFEGPSHISSIFFGGGTPSLLDAKALQHIEQALHQRFEFDQPEITLEANPDDIHLDIISIWKAFGVNRVSLGVQSFNDSVLHYLGRRHDAKKAFSACTLIANHFENWGLDLIFGAPPIDAWNDTLSACLSLQPKHISTYGLTYEENTPFAQRRQDAINDETWILLYQLADFRFRQFDHYEISNFAKEGYWCRHNLRYWKNLDYAGFGPAAYRFINGIRARNTLSFEDYIANPGQPIESLPLSEHEIKVETVIQHLRLKDGITSEAYENRFGSSLRADFGPILEALIARNLIQEFNDRFWPTQNGFEMNNEIGLQLVD